MRGKQTKPTRAEINRAWARIRAAAAEGDLTASVLIVHHDQQQAADRAAGAAALQQATDRLVAAAEQLGTRAAAH